VSNIQGFQVTEHQVENIATQEMAVVPIPIRVVSNRWKDSF
jgi:hypothetical protein